MRELVLFVVGVKQQWGGLLTGSITIVLLGLAEGTRGIHVPTFIYWLVICATLFWAFFGAWRKEYRRAEQLKDLLIREYQFSIRIARGELPTNLVYPSEEAEEKYYLEKIEGDKELIREAVRRSRKGGSTVPKQ